MELKEFLESKGVMDQFIANVNKDFNESFDNFEEAHNHINTISIGTGFIWNDSPEGGPFWCEIDIEFRGQKHEK